MVVQRMPESVKMASARLSLDTGVTGVVFPLRLGMNEVAVLLSLYYAGYMLPTAGYNVLMFGLWRKSDTDPPAMESDHTDMLWETVDSRQYTTESLSFTVREHVIFPQPLALLRAPRLVGTRLNTTAAYINMRLFYFNRTVSDEELARLMVKDHA